MASWRDRGDGSIDTSALVGFGRVSSGVWFDFVSLFSCDDCEFLFLLGGEIRIR